MHAVILQAAREAINAAPSAQHCVRQLWLKSQRIVSATAGPQHWLHAFWETLDGGAKSCDCSPGGETALHKFVPKGFPAKLPQVQGGVAFRGDDPDLTSHLC
jgi:hypothetical protein